MPLRCSLMRHLRLRKGENAVNCNPDDPGVQQVGKPGELPEVQKEMQVEIDRAEGRSWPMGSIERFAFYERAKQAYAVIVTGERRFYGCFIFKKGVIPPE